MYLCHPFLLALTEVLLLKEILQAVVICLDHEFVAHQILSEFGQGMHDFQHFLVINGLQSLGLTDLPTLEYNGVSSLHQNYPDSLIGCVTL
jgi:hypothetical protein